MLKKIAALGLTAAIAFAPLTAIAQNAAPDPAATPDAASTDTPKPMKAKKMKHHTMKHMKKHKKMMKSEEPAPDATPAADAPK